MDSVALAPIGALLLVACLIAMLSRRLGLPYIVGLVVAGFLVALLPSSPSIPLSRELIFNILLPPLVFEAALQLDWKRFRSELPLTLTLAFFGVAVAGAVVAAGMHEFFGWGWTGAALFGILIAATDPVSVIATFKESGVRGRLRLLVEAESLFNDGTAAVAFGIVVAIALGQRFSAFELTSTLVTTAGGGILCGAAIAGAVLLLAGPATDHLVELAFTTVAAYGSFLLADHFRLSGILATVTAGIMLGNLGPLGAITDKGREAVEAFWEFAAFVANSLVFLLLGLHLAQQHFSSAWRPAAAAIVIVLLGRAVAVYPCCLLFARSALRVESKHQHLLFWGGLRGALALALALGLPAELPGREDIITVSFAVVAASIFIQGLTMPPLLHKLGELTSRRWDKPVA